MADFIIVGGKAKKAKGRFGGESGGRNYDRSVSRRHLAIISRQLIAAALDEIHDNASLTKKQPASLPTTGTRDSDSGFRQERNRSHSPRCERTPERVFARGLRPSPVLKQASAVFHNSRKVVCYPDGMRIVSASY
jgi:hypothetical protein